MTIEQDMQRLCESDRDYLEMLIHKIDVMRTHGQAYYARKMQSDQRSYDAAKKELSEYVRLLKKRGYKGDRFEILPPKQGSLL